MNLNEIIVDKELSDRYYNRTNNHIQRVIDICESICDSFPDLKDKLIENCKNHDSSKFEDPEKIPYIYLTECCRCRKNNIPFEYPAGMEKKTKEAVDHHYSCNPHHPECFDDISLMDDINIIEMVCDWHAMSQEMGGTTKDWADKNVGSKWKFTPHQRDLIYYTINLLE